MHDPDLDRITMDPAQCGGRPCIRGTRIRVADVLDLLSHGASPAEILADHPELEDADLQAVQAWAATEDVRFRRDLLTSVGHMRRGEMARSTPARGPGLP